MKTPSFTAEASLYRSSAQYRSGSHAAAAYARNSIQPAEVIEVHGCAPGSEALDWGDGTWSCVPVGPDPSWPGSSGSDPIPEAGDVEARPPKGGGGTRPPRPRPKIRRNPVLGRNCTGADVGGNNIQAEVDCFKKAKPGGPLRTLRCFDNPDGSVDAVCCYMHPKGKSMVCISDVEQVS